MAAATRFTTPTNYVGGVAYCAATGRRIVKQLPRFGDTQQGLDLITTLNELFGDTETTLHENAMTVVAGNRDTWYVVAVLADRSVSIQTRCKCHADEMAADISKLHQ